MAKPLDNLTPLNADCRDFVQQYVSISLGSRDVRHMPSIGRALGCQIAPDGTRVRLFLDRRANEVLLRDIRNSGMVAVVFTRPSTHRSLQVKASNAQIEDRAEGDWDLVQAQVQTFAEDVSKLGFDARFSAAFVDCEAKDLAVVAFSPSAIYEQTPGKRAGLPIDS